MTRPYEHRASQAPRLIRKRQPRISWARSRAQQLIDLFEIWQPSEILVKEMAIHRGALVFSEASRHIGQQVCKFLAVDEKRMTPRQQRFVLAHEFGHYELHRGHSHLCTEGDVFGTNENKYWECEASAFATELLMPSSLFVPRCRLKPPRFQTVRELSLEFQTELLNTAERMIEVSDYRCALFLSHGNKILRAKVSANLGRVRPRICRSSLATPLEPRVEPRRVPFQTWFAGSNGQELLEQSLLLEDGTLLTLTWCDRR